MSLSLSFATAENVPALCELFLEYNRELQGFGMNYSLVEESLPSSIQGKIRSRMNLCAVAKEGEALVGFLFCSINRLSGFSYEGSPVFGYISDSYVSPQYRGKGLGTALCRMALDWLGENHVNYVELKVLEQNANAHSFWQRQGFSPATRVYGKRIIKTEVQNHEF